MYNQIFLTFTFSLFGIVSQMCDMAHGHLVEIWNERRFKVTFQEYYSILL